MDGAWSPSGRDLAYTLMDEPGTLHVQSLNANGGLKKAYTLRCECETEVLPGVTAKASKPHRTISWSAADVIAVTTENDVCIYELDRDADEQEPGDALTLSIGGGESFDPFSASLSADGKRIAFVSTNGRLGVITLKTKAIRVMSPQPFGFATVTNVAFNPTSPHQLVVEVQSAGINPSEALVVLNLDQSTVVESANPADPNTCNGKMYTLVTQYQSCTGISDTLVLLPANVPVNPAGVDIIVGLSSYCESLDLMAGSADDVGRCDWSRRYMVEGRAYFFLDTADKLGYASIDPAACITV